MYYYLKENLNYLKKTIAKKEIDNVEHRLRYLNAIVINNAPTYSIKETKVAERMTQKVIIDSFYYKPNLEPRKDLRRSMEELEEEYGN